MAMSRYLWMLLLIAVLSISCKQTKSEKSSHPNIVVILADDMGYGDPGIYNSSSKIPTPNIDQLADQGMRFTDAHAAGTWCVPSRYGLLTGRYPMRTSLNWNETGVIDSGRTTIASLLKEAGYQTGMVGKWHQGFSNISALRESSYSIDVKGGPADHGFDYYYGIPASLDIPPYFYIDNRHIVKPPTDSVAASQTPDATTSIQGAFWRAGKKAPNFEHAGVLPRFRDKAISFIEQSQTKKEPQPFFLYFALASPHTPWLPSKEFQGSSEAGMYGDFVVQTDEAIGQIMQKLDELNLKENTLVLFTSDNGPVWFDPDREKFGHKATAELRGMKTDTWEGGHRMPFIARWPGNIAPGSTSDALVGFTDLLATFADITDQKLAGKEENDSISMLPVLTGQKDSVRSTLVIEDRAIRKGPWKLIFDNGMGGVHRRYRPQQDSDDATQEVSGELYNLGNDLSEQHNLFEERPDKVKELKELYQSIEE